MAQSPPFARTKPPAVGQIARVRQRTYLVEAVSKPPRRQVENVPAATRVRLSCVDDDNQGAPLEVLWENELGCEVLTQEAWSEVAAQGFDAAELFAAYMNTLRWNCVTSTDPKLFQSPFRAGIRLDPYQLEPLRKALRLPRVNLFIADDVGLGKTIEAGLIARELLLRKKVSEIVVSCPPSMLLQWRDELEARFGLTFQIIDKESIARVRRERGFGVNPFSTHTRFLISQKLLIDESYTALLRDHLGTFRPGTLLILDEAHHAAPASGSRYAVDSQITRAVRDLSPRFEHRLFLSATPHNGHSNSFSALLEILDPQRFCRGVPVDAASRDEVVVRRIKEDIRVIQGGFPKRNVVQLTIDGLPDDAPELVLSQLLERYRLLCEEQAEAGSKRMRSSMAMLLTGLQQRLLSSIEAFARTLAVHRRTVQRHHERASQSEEAEQPQAATRYDLLTGSVDDDDERASLDEAALEAELEAEVQRATGEAVPPELAGYQQRLDLLDQMADVAADARSQRDARVDRLIDWIREHQCLTLGEDGAAWTDVRVLIFTEYDDTKRYLRQRLDEAIARSDRGDQRIEIFHGPTSIEDRERIKETFNAPPDRHPLRILIATDAAREGLNLQARCHNLFHFDVPWNPSRMEQRNGRIDRKLQPSEEVFCHYFVYAQRPEDRIIQALVRKTKTIREELGSLSRVIDTKLAKALAGGLPHAQLARLEGEIEGADIDPARRKAIDLELEAARERRDDLRRQIETNRDLLQKSRETIGLDDAQFRSAISQSLRILGVDPLTATTHEGTECYVFPPLEESPDPSWQETVDTLRKPRGRKQKHWEWRAEEKPRPVLFEDPGVVGDDFVHLHLEQRVAKRLLGRFSAQGFVHHDLSRACFAQSTDSVPRVVLLGRLCLYGENAARLHEELIPVTARWIDSHVRTDPLVPYEKSAETTTLALLDNALLKGGGVKLSDEITTQLRTAAAGDIAELLPHLETRAAEFAAEARLKLEARGKEEAAAMRTILINQRKTIAKTIEDLAADQLQFEFDTESERAQLRANGEHWRKRLATIEVEMTEEPSRIRRVYEVTAPPRVEPVGLVYLWPVTG